MNRRLSTSLLKGGALAASLCFVLVTLFGFTSIATAKDYGINRSDSSSSDSTDLYAFRAGTHINTVFSNLTPGATYTGSEAAAYPKCKFKLFRSDDFTVPCSQQNSSKPYCAVIGDDVGGGDRGACLSESDYVKLCKASPTSAPGAHAYAPIDKDIQGNPAPAGCRPTPELPAGIAGPGGSDESGAVGGGGSVDLNSSGLTPPDASLVKGVLKVETANELIGGMLNFFLSFVSVVAVGVLIYGGFMYITSGVIEENADRGKKAILGSVTGIILILASWTIVNTVVHLDAGQFAGGEDHPGQNISFFYTIEGAIRTPMSLSKGSPSRPVQDLDQADVIFDGTSVTLTCLKPLNFGSSDALKGYFLAGDRHGVVLSLDQRSTLKCRKNAFSTDVQAWFSNQ